MNAAVAAVKAGANVLNLTDKDLKSTDKDKVSRVDFRTSSVQVQYLLSTSSVLTSHCES